MVLGQGRPAPPFRIGVTCQPEPRWGRDLAGFAVQERQREARWPHPAQSETDAIETLRTLVHDTLTPVAERHAAADLATAADVLADAIETLGSEMRIGIRELRDTLTTTIRRVRDGEVLEVTHDGVPVAILAPVPQDRIQQLVAGGYVAAATAPRQPVRRFPVTGKLSASEAIEEERSER